MLSYYAFKYVCRPWGRYDIFEFHGYELYAGGSCCKFKLTTYKYGYEPDDNVSADENIFDELFEESPTPPSTETSV